MVWKMDSWSGGVYEQPSTIQQPKAEPVVRPRQSGNLLALVGKTEKRRVSRDRKNERLERITRINDDVLGYNLDGRLMLMRYAQNDRKFDLYTTLPFVKGVTERETGRTLLILGSNAHHIEAMQGQFSGTIWTIKEHEELKKYGNTIRWINVGDTKEGFIGLDYNPQAKATDGVALQYQDVHFVAQTLLHFGYSPDKKIFILQPPYIVERAEGKEFRKQGLETLADYAKRDTISGGRKR
jgi:hypothetical protein